MVNTRKSNQIFNVSYEDMLYDKFWYLREGDFRPEPISSFKGLNFQFFKEMIALGSVFSSKEEAAKASDEVREFIRSRYGIQS